MYPLVHLQCILLLLLLPLFFFRDAMIEKLESKIHAVEDTVFAHFCNKVGISDIREYESDRLGKSSDLIEKKRKLTDHKAKLEAALKYEESRDLEVRVIVY